MNIQYPANIPATDEDIVHLGALGAGRLFRMEESQQVWLRTYEIVAAPDVGVINVRTGGLSRRPHTTEVRPIIESEGINIRCGQFNGTVQEVLPSPPKTWVHARDIAKGDVFRLPNGGGGNDGRTLWMRTENYSQNPERKDKVRTVALRSGCVCYRSASTYVVPVKGTFIIEDWGK